MPKGFLPLRIVCTLFEGKSCQVKEAVDNSKLNDTIIAHNRVRGVMRLVKVFIPGSTSM
jgi:hypothetical protein